jgi:hypothetical protein
LHSCVSATAATSHGGCGCSSRYAFKFVIKRVTLFAKVQRFAKLTRSAALLDGHATPFA